MGLQLVKGKRVHILVISDELYPDEVGGVGKSLYNECAALVERGHRVTALIRAFNQSLPARETISGIEVVRFFGPRKDRWYYRAFPLISLWQVTRWLRANPADYDLLYLHSAIYAVQVSLAGWRGRAPVVHTFYAALDEYVHVLAEQGKYGRLKPLAHAAASVLGWLERWAFSRADAVLPRSQFSYAELRVKFPAAQIPTPADALIPLCIDTRLYTPADPATLRAALDLPADRPILITVRRLDGRMGLANLVEAMAIVTQQHPDALLMIAGKGYLRPTLEALIQQHGLQEHVRLLGFVAEADLPRYLAAADLFVLPTESLEGFGLATIEALAAGLPVLGTPIGATPELLAPLDPALLTRDSSPTALADGICRWLDDRAALRAMRARSRAAAEQHYDSRVVAARLEQLFMDLIRASRQQS